MNNWTVDIKQLKKNKKQYNIWKLEQMINFGLAGKKIKKKQIIKYWDVLRLDPKKKKYLEFLLW